MRFKLGKTKKIFEGKFVTLWGTEFFDKGGKPQLWEFVKKGDVVAIFPVTDDGRAVLIKNYRVPVQKYVIETPAGLADKEGESHEELAARELMEETGYAAKKFHPLPPYPYKSGTSGNMIYNFVATGLKKVKQEVGDDTEDLSVIEVPLGELPELFLHHPDDTYFSFEILAAYEIAKHLKIIS